MIEIKNCTKIYRNKVIGVKNINLVLPTTGLICLYGKDGSGKSTLINCLSGLDEFSSGEILIDNTNVKDLSEYSSFVFQEYKLIDDLTIYENLTLASTCCNESEIDELLKKFNLYKYKNTKVNEVPGGVCQKVEILKAIVQKSSIVFCDEPFINIDDGTEEIIISMLKELSNNRLIVIASNNITLLQKYADGLIEIDNGEITFNAIEITNKASCYKKTQDNQLPHKLAMKIAIDNIKTNKIKSILALICIFFSFITFSFILTILCINLPQILYKTYTSENTIAVYDNIGNNELSDYQIQSSNSDLILYDIPNGLTLKSDNDYNSFHKLYVASWSFAKKYKLDTTHIIVNNDIYDSLSTKKLYYLNYSFDLIKENNECKKLSVLGQNYIIITNEVFDIIKYKAYNLESIILNNEDVLRSYQLYNNLKPKYRLELTIPTDNEVIVSYDYIKDLNLDKEQIIGSTINLKFSANLGYENNDGTISFKVIGTHKNFIFSDEIFNKLYSCGGFDNISSSNKSCVYINHSLKNFIHANKLSLKPIDSLGNTIINNYNMFQNLLPFLYIILVIFLIGSILIILNITFSCINQNKRVLSVLMSLKIKQKALPKIYMCENLYICSISWLISLFIYWLTILIINSTIKKQCDISINYVTGSFSIFIILIILMFILVFIGSIIPLKKLLSRSKIDILYECA